MKLFIASVLRPVFCVNFFLHACIIFISVHASGQSAPSKISLAGEWKFKADPGDRGISEKWFLKTLDERINLPGSMTTNGKGDDITLKTPWTGSIVDSSFYFKPEYGKYRESGNIKVPFWLQPVKYYKGAAWYQKTVVIPKHTKLANAQLYLERSHWETTAWIDGRELGMRNSLAVPHVFDLGKLAPGTHTITLRVDNRIRDFNVGINSHSISDHTQSNWNGLIGDLAVVFKPEVSIEGIQLYPDIAKKQVLAKISINNAAPKTLKKQLQLTAARVSPDSKAVRPLIQEIQAKPGKNIIEVAYPMGENPLLWDEFHPNVYQMTAEIKGDEASGKTEAFGMRSFSSDNTQFTINGRKTFLRGTLECAIFPKTGYPPTDEKEWERIFRICREYGLNHMRFHSWCPPKAAFSVADKMGFYLQVECSSWANQGITLGDGLAVDKYIYDESERIVNEYGNHPSFVMMAYGNEPGGKKYSDYLRGFVKFWKARDNRRLYTTAAGWPVIAESDYNNTPKPRIQSFTAGLTSIINSKPPRNDYDWTTVISNWQHPTVSHEIGQWCVYPDFKEIKKYDGVLKAKNFEIFHDRLKASKIENLADSFLLSSGKLQVLCYKADIEAALRTPGFGGFQLLDLHDFPGQGTALVGVLNPFWEDKGYVTGREYSRFCNSTVPLARLPKMVYLNNEVLAVPVEVAHFGEKRLENVVPEWSLKNSAGRVIFSGKLTKASIPQGNAIKLGEIRQALNSITIASQLKLSVSVSGFENSWDIFVYPASLPAAGNKVLVTQTPDQNALNILNKGGSVLLSIKKGSIRPEAGGDIKVGFSSIFWNTAWTKGVAPHTLGILCDPNNRALKDFPTEYHSNWQWWDAMSHSNAIRLDKVSPDIKPIVRIIDDWFTGRSLGMLFECKVGKGKLLFSAVDLLSDTEQRPEARQLLYSLKNYMASDSFNPKTTVEAEKIRDLFIL